MLGNRICIEPETTGAKGKASTTASSVESSDFYSISDCIMQLREFEEIGGKLEKVGECHGRVIISFDDKRRYQLPHVDSKIQHELKDVISKTINILRTDVPGQEYFIKIVNTKKQKKTKPKPVSTKTQKNRSSVEYCESAIQNGGI